MSGNSGNTRAVTLRWTDGMSFSGRGTLPESPEVSIDGDAGKGPSPMHLLLLAIASCSSADVVHILGKMRVELSDLTVEASGERRATDPKRYESVHLRFNAAGPDLDLARVQRAVTLSLEKYCSVVHSLASDIEITSEVSVA